MTGSRPDDCWITLLLAILYFIWVEYKFVDWNFLSIASIVELLFLFKRFCSGWFLPKLLKLFR